MHRHMQNFSFLAILAVLLGCAFFFSQQTELGQDARLQTNTPVGNDETLTEIPTCDDSMHGHDALACYDKAANISERWVTHFVDELLALEKTDDERMAFMETQLAWEASRDADCEFIYEKSESEQTADLKRAQCLLSHNLARLEKLEGYLCDLYGASNCNLTEATSP